jgi:hypothetical protein
MPVTADPNLFSDHLCRRHIQQAIFRDMDQFRILYHPVDPDPDPQSLQAAGRTKIVER